jgi:tetratricopeptide (TPR) repeat protein
MTGNGDFQKGLALHQAGRLEEARVCYERVLEQHPTDANALHLLGLVFVAAGQPVEGAALIDRALKVDPRFAEAHNSLGTALQAQSLLDQATAAYQRAIALKPDYFEAHTNLGHVLRLKKKPAEAAAAYRRALVLQPKNAEVCNNLGIALKAQNKLPEAIAAYRQALAIQPNYAEAHNNLGAALQAQNKLDDALTSYRRALIINAGYQKAHFHEALALLLKGDFRNGWRKYEYRWTSELKHFQRPFSAPRWFGDRPLRGKSILLYAEQGIGDTLQFVRYLPQVAALGATIYLEVQPTLKPLLSSLPGVHQIFGQGELLPPFDFHCPLLSLPLAFSTELASIPAAPRYLQAPVELSLRWREALASSGGLKVGVVWSGNPGHVNDHNRSIPLTDFQRLFHQDIGRFYSLQKDIRPAEMALLEGLPEVMDLSPQIAKFTDTAAIVENLDLVISVDTSVAHLAGALGKPTWLLLPYSPDWRWLLNREDSPWYPTMRLFRQPATGDWDSVLTKVSEELVQYAVAEAVVVE